MSITVDPARLRAKMDEKGLTNARLADAAGVSEGTIKRLMRGESTSGMTLTLVADALDVPMQWLTAQSDHDDEPDASGDDQTTSPDADVDMSTRLIASYVAQIEMLTQRITDLRTLLYRERQEKHRVMVFAVALVILICAWLTIDVVNPSVGWLRG